MAAPPEREISVARFVSHMLGVVLLTVAALLTVRALGFNPWKADAQAEAAAWFDQPTAIDQRNWLDSEADLAPVSEIAGVELVRTALNVEMTGQFRGQNIYRYEWTATGVSPREATDICVSVAEQFADAQAGCAAFPASIELVGSPGPIDLAVSFDEDSGTLTIDYEPK